MSQPAVQLASPPEATLSPEVFRRAEALGVTLLRLRDGGEARALTASGRVVEAIVASSLFSGALRREWSSLTAAPGTVRELWPGVRVASLRPGPGRLAVHPPVPKKLYAVLLLGPELTESEQFHGVCGEAGLDRGAAAAEAQGDSTVSAGEAHRLALTLSWMCEDDGNLHRRGGELQGLSLELADTYEELSLLYKLASSLRVKASPETVLRDACEELHQVIGFRWLALSLVNDPRLNDVSGQTICLHVGDFDPDEMDAAADALMQRYPDLHSPMIVDRAGEIALPGVESLGQNFLIIPMRLDDGVLGVMFGADRLDGDLISSVDAKLCESLAGSLTIYLENHMLYDDAHSMFLGTLHALTAAIDAKDSYTHGHSERVALLARMLAEQVGLGHQVCERVYLSGLVHDVGKIGVPEAVLCKPGRLTADEFGLIKLHPQIGANIIRDIRQMEDLVPGVLYHHEKYDGGGYPTGRAAEEIPLFGRLIGLADAFDAMSSDRTYRKAMKLEDVLAEVTRCAGTQFDPELAAAFVQMDFAPFDRLIRKHERMRRAA